MIKNKHIYVSARLKNRRWWLIVTITFLLMCVIEWGSKVRWWGHRALN